MVQKRYMYESGTKIPWAVLTQISCAFLWAGLILGLSFIETPLKFQAPGVTREIGLGIGRLVFQTLNRIEIVLLIMMGISIFLSHTPSKVKVVFSAIAVILLSQTFWLLPILDTRTQGLLSGVEPPASIHHHLFVGAECTKLVLLILTGILTGRKLHV